MSKVTPEKAGFSSARLARIRPAMQRYIDQQKLAGIITMITRRGQTVHLEKVGMMDERFFMYFEDVDWARRFWHNGYKVVYYPNSIVYHYHGRGSKSRLGLLDAIFNRKTRWHIASAFKFFLKYRNLTVSKK